MDHIIYIIFLFALGACVGSFLNVVVWRFPRGESLWSPPSHCPKCGKQLAWYDNIPVLGWLKLAGKCRWCRAPISPKYPLVEAVTGLIFVGYYVAFFIFNLGPCAPVQYADFERPLAIARDWPIFGLYLLTVSALLAASLIDAEHFEIPIEIIWKILAPAGLIVHAIIDTPTTPGALNLSANGAAMSLGGAVGLLVSIALWYRGILPQSFPDGGPLMEVDRQEFARRGEAPPPEAEAYTKPRIRAEMRKEMLFLLPPMLGAIAWLMLTMNVAPLSRAWANLCTYHWFTGLLGSVLGLLIGGFVVWLTRILGTLGFGREAMGMGDVHLMAGVGAIVGAGAATVAFFLAPFFGILLALYMLLSGTRRELPYGPFLGMATALVMIVYCPIAERMAPGMEGLVIVLRQMFGLR